MLGEYYVERPAVTVNGYFAVFRVVFGLKDTEGIKVEE